MFDPIDVDGGQQPWGTTSVPYPAGIVSMVFFPTVGAWANYGLGSLNEDLPEFVVMGTPLADCCGGREAHRANYLGPQYDGVPLQVDPQNSMPYLSPEQGTFVEEQRQQLDLLQRLNQFTATQNPEDEAITARTRAYELAFRMQVAIPAHRRSRQ